MSLRESDMKNDLNKGRKIAKQKSIKEKHDQNNTLESML